MDINTNQMIQKLNEVHKLANEAVASKNFTQKLGGMALYAGMADFMAIQSARLLEQVVLKAQLAEGKIPSFKPRGDNYFYDMRISTRRIVKEIKKFLPFKIPNSDKLSGNIQNINNLAKNYIKTTEKFLNYRNTILHHVGSPKKTLIEIMELVDKAIITFKAMEKAHRFFFETMRPYRFGPNEIKYFYGKETTTKKDFS